MERASRSSGFLRPPLPEPHWDSFDEVSEYLDTVGLRDRNGRVW